MGMGDERPEHDRTCRRRGCTNGTMDGWYCSIRCRRRAEKGGYGQRKP